MDSTGVIPILIAGFFGVCGATTAGGGPERPTYGQVRYMSTENTARKVSIKNYIRIYSSTRTQLSLFDAS
jgi:deoxyribodipyrimidine photo-lyase